MSHFRALVRTFAPTPSGEAVDRFRELRRGSAIAISMRVAGVGVTMLMHMVLARTASADGYGLFTYLTSISTLLVVPCGLGLSTAVLRFLPGYIEGRDFGAGASLLRYCFTKVLLSWAAAAVLILAIVPYLKGWSFLDAGILSSLVLFPLFLDLSASGLIALRAYTASLSPQALVLPIAAIVIALLLPVEKKYLATLSVLGGYAVAALVALVLLARRIPAQLWNRYQGKPRDFWLKASLPMLIGAGGQLGIQNVSVIILHGSSDLATVARYGAAAKLANLVTFALSAIGTVAAPMLATAYQKGDSHGIMGVLRKAIKWSFVGACPTFLAFALFPGPFLAMFGSQFIAGESILRVLAFGQFMNAITGPVGYALMMTGRERLYAGITCAALLFDIAANLELVPRYGAYGAGVATAITIVCMNFVMLAAVVRSLRGHALVGGRHDESSHL